MDLNVTTTISQSTHYRTRPVRSGQSLHAIRFFTYVSATLLALFTLLGCGSTGSSPAVQRPVPSTTIPTKPINDFADYLEQARVAEINNDLTARNQFLLQAVADDIAKQQCHRVHPVLTPIYAQLQGEQLAQAAIYRATCPHPEDTFAERLALLQLPTYSSALQRQQWQQQAFIHEQLFAYPEALEAHINSQDYALERAWSIAQQIPDKALILKGRQDYDGFIRLTQILRKHGLDRYALAGALTRFQYNYVNHPLVIDLPAQIIALLNETLTDSKRIAVLLPLSGRLRNQAQQIKQGILAAYLASLAAPNTDNNPSQSLYFIDTNKTQDDELTSQIATADIIIGPLLKPTLDKVMQALLPHQQLLGLNRLDTPTLDPSIETVIQATPSERYFFALSPEDEAQQIAQYMFTQQYQQPILIHASDRVATRMAKAFADTWQQLQTDAQLTELTFTDNKSMRRAISSALGVDQSRSRITTLERYLGQEMFSVTRNRRDIDAFVVFANAKQTELINPMIEASISSFSTNITPVFASSRSYNHKLNQNSLRDLQNVIFTDMPWLIDEQTNGPLLAQYDAVFSEASTPQKRLFAFGYDAFALVGKITKLRLVNGLNLAGLTGILTINDKNQVTRALPRAKITSSKITLLSGQ